MNARTPRPRRHRPCGCRFTCWHDFGSPVTDDAAPGTEANEPRPTR